MPLTLYKRPGRPSWYVRGSVLGQEVDCSTRVPHQGARTAPRDGHAQRFADNLSQQLYDRALRGEANTIGFREAAQAYKAGKSRNERRLIEKLIEHFGDTPVDRIGQRDIDDAADELYPEGQPQTRNRCVYTPAGAVLHWASKRGFCPWIVLERPSGAAGFARDRSITPEEAGAILTVADDHEFRVLFTFLLYTGARITEALSLTWADIDMARQHVSLREFKTRKKRPVPMVQEIVVAFAHMARREDGRVFRWETRGAVYPYWKAAMTAAGIADFTPHDVRHTFATWARKYGRADLKKVMDMGGWKDVKSVARYAHVTSDEIRPAFDDLPKVGQARAKS